MPTLPRHARPPLLLALLVGAHCSEPARDPAADGTTTSGGSGQGATSAASAATSTVTTDPASNHPPTIMPVEDLVLDEQEPLSRTIAVEDGDGDPALG